MEHSRAIRGWATLRTKNCKNNKHDDKGSGASAALHLPTVLHEMRREDVEGEGGAVPVGQRSQDSVLVHFIGAGDKQIDDALHKHDLLKFR